MRAVILAPVQIYIYQARPCTSSALYTSNLLISRQTCQWRDRWMKVWMEGYGGQLQRKDGWLDEQISRWMDGKMKGWMDGWMDR